MFMNNSGCGSAMNTDTIPSHHNQTNQIGRIRKTMGGSSLGIAVKLPVKPMRASCVTLSE